MSKRKKVKKVKKSKNTDNAVEKVRSGLDDYYDIEIPKYVEADVVEAKKNAEKRKKTFNEEETRQSITLKKTTSCNIAAGYVGQQIASNEVAATPVVVERMVLRGFFSCLGCGVHVNEPVPAATVVGELKELLNSNKLVYVALKPDHHFTILKDDKSDKLLVFQAFEGIYTLKQWITYYFATNNDNKLTIQAWFDYFLTIFNQQASDDSRRDALRALFLPEGFGFEDKDNELQDWYPNLNLIKVASAAGFTLKSS